MSAPRGERSVDVPVRRVQPQAADSDGRDEVVVEEPLEIRIGARRVLVTMRTPGDDLDLARGLLFTEGIIDGALDVVAIRHCDDVEPDARGNVVTVSLREGFAVDDRLRDRATAMSSACGVCGKRSLEELRVGAPRVAAGPVFARAMLLAMPQHLAAAQPVFARTGGLHAAALFALDGRLLVQKEDVGRHNAVDKLIGEALRFGLPPLSGCALLISGRAGFEIVQKARRAGIPLIASVSAPSSLAIALARDGNQTLIGFLRDARFNVYCGAERVADQ